MILYLSSNFVSVVNSAVIYSPSPSLILYCLLLTTISLYFIEPLNFNDAH